jgi:hypothetical protein
MQFLEQLSGSGNCSSEDTCIKKIADLPACKFSAAVVLLYRGVEKTS